MSVKARGEIAGRTGVRRYPPNGRSSSTNDDDPSALRLAVYSLATGVTALLAAEMVIRSFGNLGGTVRTITFAVTAMLLSAAGGIYSTPILNHLREVEERVRRNRS
ncbi:hypothetical protein Pen02_52080 [Plantactinospora endophytica]|uniref:Uncharacterized protein n=1 Tax=Plantactinospora endophytica TaxID=673535 RepID=A0ABQ4E7J1_9ACTN|nr:hypothetical protein Pen02_52080 [Plantactinospora endophytica]